MTQLSVANILDVAATSMYLAQLERMRNPAPFLKSTPHLPEQLHVEYKAVKWAYDQNLNGLLLRKAANYLYTLCGRYGLLAQNLITAGGGFVTVGGVSQAEAAIFPMYKSELDFTTSIFCPDGRLFGNRLRVHVNQIPRYLEPDEYNVTPEGIEILFDGFDATAEGAKWDIDIHKVYT